LILRDPSPLLPLIAAVAVAETVEGKIKWPNDVLVEGRKVAGILAEGRPREGWAVLGIGVNVALRVDQLPPELRQVAGTLDRCEPGAIDVVLGELLEALDRRLQDSAEDVLDAWRARDALLGRTVAWAGGRGVAAGIDGEGRLVVELEDGAGRETLDAGEVHLLRGPPPEAHEQPASSQRRSVRGRGSQ